MRDVFATVAGWMDEGRSFALVTLVALRDAAPAPVGTTIALDSDGHIVGSIGAGCYESEIVDAGLQTAADGRARRLDINLTTDEDLVGVPVCGAIMRVVAWRPERAFRDEALAIAKGQRDASLRFSYDDAGTHEHFERLFPAKETLILIGATALAAELATIGRRLDFTVVVVDPRPEFGTKERVPNADVIVNESPDDYLPTALSERTSVVIVSHDPQFDLPALRCALRSEAPYIGLLGSRRTQAARRESLSDEGFSGKAFARVHGPAGLDIGGTTTGETALSILAEIVASRHERLGSPLRQTRRAIHRGDGPRRH